jgi:hypothetical protein
MMYNTRDLWLIGLCPSPVILKNAALQKVDLFPPSSDGSLGKS